MSMLVTAMSHDPAGKLANQRVAIVGVGGTGSHILDFVSRMPVEEIHLFDGDILTEENVHRCPGSVTLSEKRDKAPNKAVLHATNYANLHPNIQGFGFDIDDTNVDRLARYTTVFLSIDGGKIKRRVLDVCTQCDIFLVNVGMGVLKGQDDQFTGLVGATLCKPDAYDHVNQCFSLDDPAQVDDNHQTIELNALNAAIAVIRWKKLLGIYADNTHSLDICYSIANNTLYNEFNEP